MVRLYARAVFGGYYDSEWNFIEYARYYDLPNVERLLLDCPVEAVVNTAEGCKMLVLGDRVAKPETLEDMFTTKLDTGRTVTISLEGGCRFYIEQPPNVQRVGREPPFPDWSCFDFAYTGGEASEVYFTYHGRRVVRKCYKRLGGVDCSHCFSDFACGNRVEL